MGFLVPKMPDVKSIPVPDRSDEETQRNAEETRRRLLAGKGTSFLTGGMGVPGGAQSYAGSKLLGGGS